LESIRQLHKCFNVLKFKVFAESNMEWNAMYSAWIKIDDSLPWVELKEAFRTKTEAKEAMKQKLGKVKIKIVKMGPNKYTKENSANLSS
jgi:hypothetical protein